MNSDTTSWRHEWVIDPDPLAAAQARHAPTGFGMTLERIEAIAVEPGDRPFVAVICADDSRDLAMQLANAAGQRVNDWIKDKGKQALELWRALDMDLDPTRALVEPLPCRVRSWRDEWTTHDRDDGRDGPDLVHASGFAVQYAYKALNDDGRMSWFATALPGPVEGGSAAETEPGRAKHEHARLLREASILWMDLGYFDGSPTRVVDPFGSEWRSLWKVKEEPGQQWLEHVSGLAIAPAYGVVDDFGNRAWYLHDQDYRLDMEMRQKVGGKAWRRVRDQGWKLCVELGYVTDQPVAVD